MSDNNDIFDTIMEGIDRTVPAVPVSNNDMEYVKDNIKSIISKGNIALDEMLKVCLESGHPRAYEVFTNLMGTLVSANKDLIDTKRINQEIEGGGQGGDNITNNLVLTTADLVKLIEEQKENSAKEIVIEQPK